MKRFPQLKYILVGGLIVIVACMVYINTFNYKKFSVDFDLYCEVATERCICFGNADNFTLDSFPPQFVYNCKGIELCMPIEEERRNCELYEGFKNSELD